ncbi:hypothetical protein COE15_02350 [Bacillus cereus]|uniref:DUF3947 family protein n=1 Tax=Bacillus sp. AFS023182 TaxID=2033492 RepID=UPI000BF6BB8A|nr:DUF3947 family protein [Bacillus sp. AFS023182]PFE06007.1 hypothetical protein CN288_04500 [Bacillus sp. AFS023182]PGY04124.1 hypothetical protein COE15_02350 [Bacillus cereus]
MFPSYFYNEMRKRPLGGHGPAQSTIQAVHQAIQAQQQAIQAQQMQQSIQPYYHSLQYYYPMYIMQYRIPFSTVPYETAYYL